MRRGWVRAAGLLSVCWAMGLHDPVSAQLPPIPGGGQGQQGVVGGRLPSGGGDPARAAPRRPDGRVLLGGATPDDKAVWVPGAVVAEPLRPAETIPFQPWAEQMYAYAPFSFGQCRERMHRLSAPICRRSDPRRLERPESL